jgi:hypothetical protein
MTSRRFRVAPSAHTRVFDGELVILDMAGGEYLALDAIGLRLWNALESGREIEQVAQEIAAEYDVTLEQARGDLEALAAELVSRGLLIPEEH